MFNHGKLLKDAGRRKYFAVLMAVPLLAVFIFSFAAFRFGSPGFKVDKTQQGLYVSEVSEHPNPVRRGDFIVGIGGRSYSEVLGLLLSGSSHGAVQESGNTIVVRRNDREITLTPIYHPVSWWKYLSIAWPHLLLIFLFLSLALIALFKAGAGEPVVLFFFMLCSFATTIATTLPSHFGLLDPRIISLSFLGITLSNWLAFGALAHFICRFPRERDICRARPFLAPIFYLFPPLIAIGSALYTAGFTIDFFGSLERFRNLCLPIIIVGSFAKHLIDIRYLRSPSAKNQVKLSLTAYWLTFAPYLLLYLLPNLLVDQPLISFRIVLLSAIILPAAYLIALLRYRLLGVDSLISRTIAYFVVVFLFTLSYALLLTLVKRWFFGRRIFSEEVFLVFIVIVALAITPVVNWVQRLIDRYFFRYRPNDDTLLFEFSQKLAATLRFSELITLITDELPRQIQTAGSALLLLDGHYSRLYPQHLRIGSAPWPDSRLVRLFKLGEQAVFCREEQAEARLNLELSELRKAGYYLVLPLRGSRGLTGLLLLGARKDGRLFRDHDIRLLATLANQIAVALKNSLLYTSLSESKEQLESLFSKVVQSEKMAALGEMSATLTHEIKNPLGIIRSSAQYLATARRSESINQEMLNYIIEEVDGLNAVVSRILGLAKFENPRLKPVDLEREIAVMCERWRQSDDHNPHIRLQYSIARRLPPLYADFQQLRQVFLNILRNSEEAMHDSGTIALVVAREEEFVLFRLLDDGPGIADGCQNELFENFFTTKQDGLGLGLSVCQHIITAHHGTITIKNRSQGGAEVLIKLPFKPLAVNGMKGVIMEKTDES
ncbi:ATP-binding protein [Desulfobacterota bacterium M19]